MGFEDYLNILFKLFKIFNLEFSNFSYFLTTFFFNHKVTDGRMDKIYA